MSQLESNITTLSAQPASPARTELLALSADLKAGKLTGCARSAAALNLEIYCGNPGMGICEALTMFDAMCRRSALSLPKASRGIETFHASNLVALRVGNNALADAPNLPTRLKVLAWGTNESTKGPVKLGAFASENLMKLQKESGFEQVALDFEHNTVPGSSEYERTAEPRAVAAFGTPNLVEGDGLYLEDLQWTPEGRKHAFNYADLSPAVSRGNDGEVQFLHSVALTRHGSVDGLTFFSADAGAAKTKPDWSHLHGSDLAAAAINAQIDADNAAERERRDLEQRAIASEKDMVNRLNFYQPR